MWCSEAPVLRFVPCCPCLRRDQDCGLQIEAHGALEGVQSADLASIAIVREVLVVPGSQFVVDWQQVERESRCWADLRADFALTDALVRSLHRTAPGTILPYLLRS